MLKEKRHRNVKVLRIMWGMLWILRIKRMMSMQLNEFVKMGQQESSTSECLVHFQAVILSKFFPHLIFSKQSKQVLSRILHVQLEIILCLVLYWILMQIHFSVTEYFRTPGQNLLLEKRGIWISVDITSLIISNCVNTLIFLSSTVFETMQNVSFFIISSCTPLRINLSREQ